MLPGGGSDFLVILLLQSVNIELISKIIRGTRIVLFNTLISFSVTLIVGGHVGLIEYLTSKLGDVLKRKGNKFDITNYLYFSE